MVFSVISRSEYNLYWFQMFEYCKFIRRRLPTAKIRTWWNQSEKTKRKTKVCGRRRNKMSREQWNILYAHDWFNVENKFLLKCCVSGINTYFDFVVASILFYSMTFPFFTCWFSPISSVSRTIPLKWSRFA